MSSGGYVHWTLDIVNKGTGYVFHCWRASIRFDPVEGLAQASKPFTRVRSAIRIGKILPRQPQQQGTSPLKREFQKRLALSGAHADDGNQSSKLPKLARVQYSGSEPRGAVQPMLLKSKVLAPNQSRPRPWQCCSDSPLGSSDNGHAHCYCSAE